MTIAVGIIDDHPALILGVSGFLNEQTDISVTGTSDTVPGLLATNTAFDVVLLDLVLNDGSNPHSNVHLLHSHGIRVLAYTSGERTQLVQEASKAGVLGMIRKSEAPEAISEAIRSVARNEAVATADWAAALDSDTQFVKTDLTFREAQVLELYASGETAERVAAQLFITRETVLDHIRRIRIKYAAASRPARTKVDLFRRAVEDGIISSGS